MFRKKYEKPIAEWPYTQVLKDGGVRIYGKYVQPMLPGRVFALSALIVGIFAYSVAVNAESVAPGVMVVVGSIVAWYAGLRAALHNTFGRSVDLKVYPDRIAVRQGFGYKTYSRDYPIEFRVERHEKAVQEESNAMRTGNNSFRVFREALQVVMQYGEKRVPLAELRVKDIEQAKALLIRLQNVCESLDQARQQISEEYVRSTQTLEVFGPAPPIR